VNRKIAAAVAGVALVASLAACGTPVIDNNSPANQPAAAAPAPAASTVTASPAAPVIIQNQNNNGAAGTESAAPVSSYDPWSQVSQYYTYISEGDYSDAWNMGSQAFMDQNGDQYQSWVNGYANTTNISVTENWESQGTVNFALSDYDTATDSTQNFTCQFTVDTGSGLITGGTCS
jgi:hypothetical protein